MSGVAAAPVAAKPARRGVRKAPLAALALAVVVVAAIALDTTVVRIGSDGDAQAEAFSADRYGQKEFPRIQGAVEAKAVDAATLGPAVLADRAAAAKQYGTPSSTGAIVPVRLSGTVGAVRAGIADLAVPGLPPDIRVRLQVGPAINGTDLRDAPGDVAFGDFTNQIEYQDAGSGLNRAMKAAVLDPVDVPNLSGKTVDVVGAFRLINPKNWLVTPVRVAVK